MDYLWLIISTVLLAVNFVLVKFYQNKTGTDNFFAMFMIFLSSLFSVAIFFFLGGFKIEFTLTSVLLAAASGGLCLAYTLIGYVVMKNNTVAYYTLFLMVGGMVVPYIWGVLKLGEELSLLRIFGLAAILLGVVVSELPDKAEKIKPAMLLLLAAIFLLNGFVSVASKEHQISPFAVSSESFVALSALARVIISGIILIFMRPRNKSEITVLEKPAVYVITVASALVSGVSYLLQLNSAKNLPATVTYPIITGGAIVFTAVMGLIFFKEKMSRKLTAGIILCVIGTCLFL